MLSFTVALAVGRVMQQLHQMELKLKSSNLQDDDTPMQLSFAASSDENNAEGAT